jgi:S1-C subfamily serine protease
VFVSKEGLLITNAHVVLGASRIEVIASVGPRQQEARRSILGSPPRSYPARIVGIDLETDLALLKIDAITTSFLRFGDSDRLALGQVVLAFGSPLGLGGSVSMGVVSSRARQLEPESPMLARLILSAKPDENRVTRLNIVAFDLTPDIAQLVPGLRNPRGVLVGRVAEGSPLAAGDIILRINDTPTGDLSHLKGVLARIPERDPVVATVERASLVRYVVLEN